MHRSTRAERRRGREKNPPVRRREAERTEGQHRVGCSRVGNSATSAPYAAPVVEMLVVEICALLAPRRHRTHYTHTHTLPPPPGEGEGGGEGEGEGIPRATFFHRARGVSVTEVGTVRGAWCVWIQTLWVSSHLVGASQPASQPPSSVPSNLADDGSVRIVRNLRLPLRLLRARMYLRDSRRLPACRLRPQACQLCTLRPAHAPGSADAAHGAPLRGDDARALPAGWDAQSGKGSEGEGTLVGWRTASKGQA